MAILYGVGWIPLARAIAECVGLGCRIASVVEQIYWHLAADANHGLRERAVCLLSTVCLHDSTFTVTIVDARQAARAGRHSRCAQRLEMLMWYDMR